VQLGDLLIQRHLGDELSGPLRGGLGGIQPRLLVPGHAGVARAGGARYQADGHGGRGCDRDDYAREMSDVSHAVTITDLAARE
jgi:hypothetical protein